MSPHVIATADGCTVCPVRRDLEDERNRLTEEVTTLGIQSMGDEGRYHEMCEEQSRLRAVMDAAGAPPSDDLAARVQIIVSARDRAEGDGFAMHDEINEDNTRLRAVVDALTPFVDHREDCAVEADMPCDCGLDRIYAQLDEEAT